ncbi:7620_t:CDS:2 [Acaulospora colombiana]|uniref:7620_t:CDS:1 n=1 Tax=Acaulospora colombiana TaxID=27376 RepID=A0ACA9KT46_9GLOM|nr:7620_t:CDS:2 [Acaulospora colombiana]
MYEDSEQDIWNEKTKERLAKLRAEYTAREDTESSLVPTKRSPINKVKGSVEIKKKQRSLSKTSKRQERNASNLFTSQPSSTLSTESYDCSTEKSLFKSIVGSEGSHTYANSEILTGSSKALLVFAESNGAKVNAIEIEDKFNDTFVTESLSEDISSRAEDMLNQLDIDLISDEMEIDDNENYLESNVATTELIRATESGLETVDAKVESRANENKFTQKTGSTREGSNIGTLNIKFETVFDSKKLIKTKSILAKSNTNISDTFVESTSTTVELAEVKSTNVETQESRNIKDPSTWSALFSYTKGISVENSPKPKKTYPTTHGINRSASPFAKQNRWSHGPVYCSVVTGNLVIQQLRVNDRYVKRLPMDEEVEIEGTGVKVTLIDANHCPGSVLFLFKDKLANGETMRYLHTGDFRACPRQILHSAIRQPANPEIDVLYLDTTYLNPSYSFPAQELVVNAIIQLVKKAAKNGKLLPMKSNRNTKKQQQDKSQLSLTQWIKCKPQSPSNNDTGSFGVSSEKAADLKLPTTDISTHKEEEQTRLKGSKILVLVGAYLIGKEKVFHGIARALDSKIYALDSKRKILLCQENPELESLLTHNPHEASVHVVSIKLLKLESLLAYLKELEPTFKYVMAFRPTGWSFRSSEDLKAVGNDITQEILNKASPYTMDSITPSYHSPTCQIFEVPYSEHSSFRELAAFVMSLNVKKIIPTVNNGSEKSRNEMEVWLNQWQNAKKRKKVEVVPYPDANYCKYHGKRLVL